MIGGTAAGDSASAYVPQVETTTRAQASKHEVRPQKERPCDAKYIATEQPRVPASSARATMGTQVPSQSLPPPPPRAIELPPAA